MRRGFTIQKYLSVILFVTVLGSTVFAVTADTEDLPFDFKLFKKKASVSFEKSFLLDVSLERWNAMLDKPALMGQLWEAVDGDPLYRISTIGTTVHVVDPTGIEGHLALLRHEQDRRLYYGSGRMNRWFVPMTLKGKAVLLLECEEKSEGSIEVTLRIYGEGGKDRMTRIMLKTVSPLICYGIERRVARNLKDLERILEMMEHSPDELRAKLQGNYAHEFNTLVSGEHI